MKNLIILAGGEVGPLSQSHDCNNKAELEIHGKAMLDWVLDAFYQSGVIDQIVVVGSEELDQLAAMRRVRKRLPAGSSVIQNLVQAIAYIKGVIYHGAEDHEGYFDFVL